MLSTDKKPYTGATEETLGLEGSLGKGFLHCIKVVQAQFINKLCRAFQMNLQSFRDPEQSSLQGNTTWISKASLVE